jgi:hypothetical protein
VGLEAERDVEQARAHRRDGLAAADLGHVHAQLRVRAVDALERGDDERAQRGREGADVDAAGLERADRSEVLARAIEVAGDDSRALEEQLARGREREPVAPPQERHPGGCLQRRHRPAHRGLGEVQPRRRARERAGVGHRLEHQQPPRVDRHRGPIRCARLGLDIEQTLCIAERSFCQSR